MFLYVPYLYTVNWCDGTTPNFFLILFWKTRYNLTKLSEDIRLKQFIIPIQHVKIFCYKACWSLRMTSSFQETFVENKQDGVSRKYIPPARWALTSFYSENGTEYWLQFISVNCLFVDMFLCPVRYAWTDISYKVDWTAETSPTGWCPQRVPIASHWLEKHRMVALWKILVVDWR